MNPALQGYLVAMVESLTRAGALDQAAAELQSVAGLVDANSELALAVNDGAVPVAARRAVLDDLLEGKVRPEVGRLVHQAVTVVPAAEVEAAFHWLASRVRAAAMRDPAAVGPPEEEDVLGRLGARHRVAGYAAAVFEQVTVAELEEIEDQLFRFARTVAANRPLRQAFGDRNLPVALRVQLVDDLLAGQALEATTRLAGYAVRGGRARDFVATLDALVEAAARARGWRVARVHSADAVAEAQRRGLSEALARLAGNPVDLQVTIDDRLLGGVVVELGDLLVDGSVRHRLDELKEHLLESEAAYQIPEGRNAADG